MNKETQCELPNASVFCCFLQVLDTFDYLNVMKLMELWNIHVPRHSYFKNIISIQITNLSSLKGINNCKYGIETSGKYKQFI